MSLENQYSITHFEGNGSTTAFPFEFKVWEAGHVKVYVNATGAQEDVTESVTITLNDGGDAGGVVTFSTAPADGVRIAIARKMPFIQEDRYVSGTRIDPHELEDRFDQDCAERQELREAISRAFVTPETSEKTGEEYMEEMHDLVSAAAETAQETAGIVATLDTITPYVISEKDAPADCGGDRIASLGSWVHRACQSSFVDPFDKILGVTFKSTFGGYTDGKTGVAFMRWDENPAKRTPVGWTGFLADFLSHQSVSLYRPTAADTPRLVCLLNRVVSADSADAGRVRYCRVMMIDYESGAYTIEKTFKMWDTSYTSPSGIQMCISSDGAYLICRAIKTADSKRIYRVWDFPALLEQYPDTYTTTAQAPDITGDVLYEFEAPYGATNEGGQGIYSDGRYIYSLSSNQQLDGASTYGIRIEGITQQNQVAYVSRDVPATIDVFYDTTYGVSVEAESIFWAPYFGKTEMFVTASVQEFTNAAKTEWHRYQRYLSPTVIRGAGIVRYDKATSDSGSITIPVKGFFKDGTSVPSFAVYGNVFFTDESGLTENALGSVSVKCDTNGVNQLRLRINKSTNADLVGVLVDVSNSTGDMSFRPMQADVSNYLGSPSYKWDEIYAQNGTINTSDERAKDNITAFPDAALDAWGEVQWSQYQMRDALAEKGEAARLHSGVIAQRVASIFEAHGLDASRYGLFCHNSWDDEYEEQENGQRKLVREAGDGYGIRYAEALAMEAAYQRRRAGRAEVRISTLEQRLDEMEAAIAALL